MGEKFISNSLYFHKLATGTLRAIRRHLITFCFILFYFITTIVRVHAR